MVKSVVRLALTLLIFFSFTVPVGADNSGRIDGRMVNLTAGSTSSLAGHIIIIQSYKGATKIDEKSTLTDSDGRFDFEGLDNEPLLVYVVQTVFQNVHYFADQISFKSGDDLITVTINVYDTTTKADDLSVEMSHVILSPAGNTLNVKENYYFVNQSDLTYIGSPQAGSSDQRAGIIFSVPPGATALAMSIPQPETPQIEKNNTFAASSPVSPDGVFFSYNYKLEINQDFRSLSWNINYNTGRFDLLIDGDTVNVKSDRLTKGDSLIISGKTYQDYSAEGLKKGDIITVQLSGLTGDKKGFNYLWLLLILIPAAIAAFAVFRRRKSIPITDDAGAMISTASNGSDNQETTVYENTRTKLIQEIAALDDSFENGDIDEAEYRELRKAKKERLLKLTDSQGE